MHCQLILDEKKKQKQKQITKNKNKTNKNITKVNASKQSKANNKKNQKMGKL